MGGWWGQCRICSRDSNKGSSGTAWHELYVRLPLLRRFVCCSKKKFHEWHWQRNSHCTMMIFFFCSSSSAAALDFFRCIVQSVWGKQWYESASGNCISFTQANSDGDDKTTKCTKEFPYFPFVFVFFVYVSERVGVCVCGDSGVALWYNSLKCHNNLQRNDICKVTRQNSLKMMHKHVFSLSLFHFQNKRAFNMRIDECAVSTENKKNKISSLFSCQFPI